jgi:ribosomal protein L6P/L9E
LKWYGSWTYSKQSFVKNLKKRKLDIEKLSQLSTHIGLNFNAKTIYIYIPANWKFLIINKKKLNNVTCFLYSPLYYLSLPLSKKFSQIHYDVQTKNLILNFFYTNNFSNIFWILFKNIFSSFSKIFFKKLKFKGKGYYIFKNLRNTVALQFGYSHLIRIYSYFINVKFLSKTSILLFGINKLNLIRTGKNLFITRPINIFTSKGMRFSRQIIYKKTGKISSYR